MSRAVRNQVDELPGHVRQRARRLISSLAYDPRPPGAKELRDLPGHYRIPIDRWRLVYRVDDEAGEVTVLAVKRKTGPETYMGLGN